MECACPIMDNEVEMENKTCDIELKAGQVVLIIGGRGSGKSLHGFRLLEEFHSKKACNKVYVLGIPLSKQRLLPDWIKIINKIDDVPKNAVLLVDEAGIIYQSTRKKDNLLRFMLQICRHKNLQLIYCNLSSSAVDIEIIRNVDVLAIHLPSLLQGELERRGVDGLVKKAQKEFDKIPESERKEHCFIIGDKCQGVIHVNKPSFWSEELSISWADEEIKKNPVAMCPILENPSKEVATKLMELFISTHKSTIEEIKRVDGDFPEECKRFDKRHAEKFFLNLAHKNMNGFDFIAKLQSDLLVKHFLPNANHRTSLHFINGFLAFRNVEIKFEIGGKEKIVSDYFTESKAILRNRKKDGDYAEKHLNLTKKFLKKVLGETQSKLIREVLPIAFMDFRTASSNRNVNSCSVIPMNNTMHNISNLPKTTATIKSITYKCPAIPTPTGICRSPIAVAEQKLWKHEFESNNPKYNPKMREIVGRIDMTSAGISDCEGKGCKNTRLLGCPTHGLIGNLKNIELEGGEQVFFPDGTTLHTNIPEGNTLCIKSPSRNPVVGSPNMVMFLYSPNCGHCQDFKPKILSLKQKYKGVIDFQLVDLDKEPDVKKDIKVYPTIFLIKRGRIVKKISGIPSGGIRGLERSLLDVYQPKILA